MSALNVTLALPPARGADATAGKPIDMDDDGGQGGGFGDVFRELTQPAGDGTRSDNSRPDGERQADTDATRAARATPPEGTAGPSMQTLADALAAAAGRRAAGGDTPGSARAKDGQTPAETVATNGSLDTATADVAAPPAKTTRAAVAAGTAAQAQRMQDHRGLTSLLFGNADADTEATLSPTRIAADATGSKTAANTKAARDASDVRADDAGPTFPAATDTPTPLPQASLESLLPLQLPTPQEQDGGAQGDKAGSGAITGHTPTAAAEPADAQPMRITILSRETHFAPIRTLLLNGASAPTAEADAAFKAATAAAAGAAQATTGAAGTSPTRTTGAMQQWATAMAAPKGKLTASTTASGAPTAEAFAVGTAEREAATSGTPTAQEARAQRVTGQDPDVRTDDRRTAAKAAAPTAREAVANDVSQARATDASAHVAADGATPAAGTASAGPATITPAPSLPTLRQIGAAIAAEVGTMGAPTAPGTPTASLAAGPVRLLDIQLTPDELGTVNVRMRLSSNGLEIRLRASNADTARMLERDQGALKDLLKAAGITADSITIVGGDGAGLTQLTGQDAGRPFTAAQQPSGEAADPRDRNFSDQQGGRSNDEDSQKGQARDDQARSAGRNRDTGSSSFRL